ncbi:MAG TPA: dihydrodipicolinate synthase family protein [Fimbriimonadaceae bacterium]|nr:dihydrodipicolinate synthase family protein [Fimbriimonadaceae bacterium]
MIAPGVYPAAVTPLDERGRLDFAGLAKLLAWFESAGCQGAVLAGTNGEGPSLSAVEKRELIEQGMELRGKLELILGIATPSLEEAVWLCRRGADAGAAAALVMAPGYFREATEQGIHDWFGELLVRSPLPVLVYNFPQRTGITLSASLMKKLAEHPNMAGLKDSSGDETNLASYRLALPEDKVLFVGNETLLLDALRAGWSGTISGAANSVPHWLSQIVAEWNDGKRESAEAKFSILLPVLEAIRTTSQPAGHKGVLHAYGVLPTSSLKLPLERAGAETVRSLLQTIEQATGNAVRP